MILPSKLLLTYADVSSVNALVARLSDDNRSVIM